MEPMTGIEPAYSAWEVDLVLRRSVHFCAGPDSPHVTSAPMSVQPAQSL